MGDCDALCILFVIVSNFLFHHSCLGQFARIKSALAAWIPSIPFLNGINSVTLREDNKALFIKDKGHNTPLQTVPQLKWFAEMLKWFMLLF